jgi:hypothetical protein
LREGESPVLPGESREEEGLRCLGRSFLCHLELGCEETIYHHLGPLSCGLGGGALEARGGAVPGHPDLACLKLPLRDNVTKILLWDY